MTEAFAISPAPHPTQLSSRRPRRASQLEQRPSPPRRGEGFSSPLPDEAEAGHQARDDGFLDRDQAADEVGGGEATRLRVFLDDVHLHALGDQAREVAGQVGRLGLLPVSESNARGVLALHAVVHGVAPQQHGGLSPAAADGMREPHDGVVLLFDGRPVRALDDLENLLVHGVPPQPLVGITSVLSAASAIFQKSTGLPRPTPATASPTPRSSTQRPQLVQVSLPPLFSAWAVRAMIQSFGLGWSSCATSRPCTALACGACLAKDSATAPS